MTHSKEKESHNNQQEVFNNDLPHEQNFSIGQNLYETKVLVNKAVIAQGLHLLPFRTEKLNLVTPMVLPTRESRKRPPYMRVLDSYSPVLFFCSPSMGIL